MKHSKKWLIMRIVALTVSCQSPIRTVRQRSMETWNIM